MRLLWEILHRATCSRSGIGHLWKIKRVHAVPRVGDGDCGSTLRRGAEAMQADLAHRLPLNDAAATLKGLAGTLRVMGGTSGVLYVISLTAAAGEPRQPAPVQASCKADAACWMLPACGTGLAINIFSGRLRSSLQASRPYAKQNIPACLHAGNPHDTALPANVPSSCELVLDDESVALMMQGAYRSAAQVQVRRAPQGGTGPGPLARPSRPCSATPKQRRATAPWWMPSSQHRRPSQKQSMQVPHAPSSVDRTP